MKHSSIIILLVLLFFLSGCTSRFSSEEICPLVRYTGEENTWRDWEHKPYRNGYLHDFPCHQGESAVNNLLSVYGWNDSFYYQKPNGCYFNEDYRGSMGANEAKAKGYN